MEEHNAEVIWRLFAAQDDVDAVYALFDPHIEWEDVSGLWVARVRAYGDRSEALEALGTT